MQAWQWKEFASAWLKVYQRPGATYPYGTVQKLDHGCYTAIIRCHSEPHGHLGRFPTSAEAEAAVEAVMPIYWAERGYE